jgi:NAD+ synthetase
VKELIAAGADLIVNLSASPWHRSKERTRLAMLQRVASDEHVPLVQVNLVGGNDELIFDGHSVALDQQGQLLAAGRGFSEDLILAELGEPKATSKSQAKRTNQTSPAAHAFPDDEQQLFSALTLGIRDYVQKCGFKRVVLGLSGGIDSALTAVLAVEALGSENVLGVAMPSKFSSEGSIKDAEALARNLGIRFEILPIESVVGATETQLSGVFAGLPRNEAEENIQSRLRGLTLMALSNKFGSLVLTTGNKSEMAVGYCTLYGDMCGALAPIADLFKTEIYRLARWIKMVQERIAFQGLPARICWLGYGERAVTARFDFNLKADLKQIPLRLGDWQLAQFVGQILVHARDQAVHQIRQKIVEAFLLGHVYPRIVGSQVAIGG